MVLAAPSVSELQQARDACPGGADDRPQRTDDSCLGGANVTVERSMPLPSGKEVNGSKPHHAAGGAEEAWSQEPIQRPTTSTVEFNASPQLQWLSHESFPSSRSILGIEDGATQWLPATAFDAVAPDGVPIFEPGQHGREPDRDFDPMWLEATATAWAMHSAQAERPVEEPQSLDSGLQAMAENQILTTDLTPPTAQDNHLPTHQPSKEPGMFEVSTHDAQDASQDMQDALRASQTTFVCGITKPLSQAPLPGLATPPTLTMQENSAPVTTIRYSKRIAMFANARPALERAQCVLMRKLGILKEQEQMSQEDREAYTKLFEHPLSRPQLAALAALFGWTILEHCEVRSAELLESLA